jgi:hypothetical protein
MPWNAISKRIERLFAFVDQFAPGETAMRSGFDAYHTDLNESVNAAIAYLEALSAGAIYLGEFAAPPATRPDGSQLISGDFYLDTDDGILYRFDSNAVGWFPILPPSGSSSFVTSQVLPAESAAALRAVLELGSAATASTASFQQANDRLSAFAQLSPVADRLPYFTGAATMALSALTNFARTLLDDGNAEAARATLGLGALAIQSSVGPSQLVAGERMTTANVLAAQAGLSAADVGTYVFARADANVSIGDTLAGASLQPTSAGSQFTLGGGAGTVNANLGGGLPGAWRCMGQLTPSTTASGAATISFATLWLRVS